MRKITVTEENFEEILEKLQKICNKYKMFSFYRVYSEDMREQKQYRKNDIGSYTRVKYKTDKKGRKNFKKVREFYAVNSYICVTKHQFREAYERGEDNYDVREIYSEMKCLIHMDMNAGSALDISEGDKVQFFPFGGFAVWTDDELTRFDDDLTIYKDAFFPDFLRGKIKNLEEENKKRDAEWEEEERWWAEQGEREFEREWNNADYDYDWSDPMCSLEDED